MLELEAATLEAAAADFGSALARFLLSVFHRGGGFAGGVAINEGSIASGHLPVSAFISLNGFCIADCIIPHARANHWSLSYSASSDVHVLH